MLGPGGRHGGSDDNLLLLAGCELFLACRLAGLLWRCRPVSAGLGRPAFGGFSLVLGCRLAVVVPLLAPVAEQGLLGVPVHGVVDVGGGFLPV